MHEGRSLLHVAAAEGRLNTARVLLEHNADITATVSPICIHTVYYSKTMYSPTTCRFDFYGTLHLYITSSHMYSESQ